MYYERLPAYVYELPCGHTFRSLTRSEATTGELDEDEVGDSENGAHWFFCGPCKGFQVVEPGELVEHAPTKFPGNQGKVVDQAVRLDRIRAHYLDVWDSETLDQVAERFHVGKQTAFKVASDLGVYA